MSAHGTVARYRKGCRLDCCKKAWAKYCSMRRKERSKEMPEGMHGTVSGYTNYLCRCAACTKANTDDVLRRRREK